jgi:cellulase/cellobiase CelA1
MGIATHTAEWIRPRVVAAWLVAAGTVGCSPPPPDAAANPFGGAGSDGGAGGPTPVDGGTTEAAESSTTEPSTTAPSSAGPTTEPSTTAPSSGADTDTSASGTTEHGDSSSTGAADVGSSGSSSTGGDGGVADTYDDGVVHVLVEIQSMWDAGECDDITVTNISDAPVTWEVDVPLPGVVYQLWNAEMLEMGGIGTFVGVDFNADLDPGESAMFGFCVNY